MPKPRDKPHKLKDSNGLYLEIKPNGVKAWRYRFELREDGNQPKRVAPATGDYTNAPSGETPEEAKARRDGRRFTLAEAQDERSKAGAGETVIRRSIGNDTIKREQEIATTFEAAASANGWP